jgi:hypothetical protein
VLQGVFLVLVVIAVVSNLRKPRGIDPPEKRRLPARSHAEVPAVPESGTPRLTRNLFEYGERAATAPPVAIRTPAPTEATPPPTATPAPVRLVGIVQAAGGLRAALAMDGEVLVGFRGEKLRGYTIVAIDEDSGVVLKGPDGEKLELRPVETR